MLAKYATIVRRAAALTAIAAAIMVAVSAALVGVKGLIGALIGVAIVTVFFGISVLVVGRAARVSPGAMMVAALVTYLVKIIALAIIVSNMNGATAFSTRTVGFVAIGCILVWSAAQVITAVKVKTKTCRVGQGRNARSFPGVAVSDAPPPRLPKKGGIHRQKAFTHLDPVLTSARPSYSLPLSGLTSPRPRRWS